MPGCTEISADVVVVGAGSTGLLTALLLTGYGYSVALIEMWPQAPILPGEQGASHDVLRDVLGHLVPDRPGLILLCGWEAISVSGGDGADRAVVEALPFPGGTPSSASMRVAGRFVVGCDGATSTVRDVVCEEMVGLGVPDDLAGLDACPCRDDDRWADGPGAAGRRAGQVLVAGAAAHPRSGAGDPDSGMRDAAVVAWQLDQVLRGVAGPELLDTDTWGPDVDARPADVITELLDRLRVAP